MSPSFGLLVMSFIWWGLLAIGLTAFSHGARGSCGVLNRDGRSSTAETFDCQQRHSRWPHWSTSNASSIPSHPDRSRGREVVDLKLVYAVCDCCHNTAVIVQCVAGGRVLEELDFISKAFLADLKSHSRKPTRHVRPLKAVSIV
jgi:hypothetical protein